MHRPAKGCPVLVHLVTLQHRRVSAAVFVAILLLGGVPARAAADGVQAAGNVLQVALPAVAGALVIQRHDRTGAEQMTWSAMLALGTTLTLKMSVDERRPDGGPHSFPSGHAAISFESAEFVRRRYGWALGLPAYALAGFVGYSRVASHQHYAHDVVAGAAIGTASALVFTRPYHGWRASVQADAGHLGIVVARR